MKKVIILFVLVIVLMCNLLVGQDQFDPAVDGWFFSNWGEEGDNCIGSCDFSWDLFRKTYLGIYPTKDPVSAPLDCAFYEIFKNCAQKGNCGGMSVLGLALFKYGGYMGFCKPANFYSGLESPDRQDLHYAINIIQARQFSVSGITRFIDAVDRGTLNNAEAAFDNVTEQLGKGDYPVIWVATDSIGGAAHTLIPYKVEDYGAQKIMYIWDSNHPYDNDPSRYAPGSTTNRLVINGPINWSYTTGTPPNHTTYSGGGWCLCVPMSDIMKKSRHPLAVDVAVEILQTLFVGGPGAAVSQITDEEGRRFYKTTNNVHTSFNDIETDPNKRLKGVIRWPWLGRNSKGKMPGELYFIRAPRGKMPNLTVTLNGKNYKALYHAIGNLVEIESRSPSRATDVITFTSLASDNQSLAIKTTGRKEFDIKQLRIGAGKRDYRSFHVKRLKIDANTLRVPITIGVIGDFAGVEVSAKDRTVQFDMDILRNKDGKFTVRNLEKLSTAPGKRLNVAPENWKQLKSTKVKQQLRLPLKKLKKKK